MHFNPESPFFQFMNTLASFIGLNVLFLITCLPVITIGPALAALYTVTMQEARKESGYVFTTYLKAFKNNFRQGVAAFLIFLVLALVFLYNVFFWGEWNTALGNTILFLMTALSLFLILIFLYFFPLMARFENTIKQTFKNAFCLAVTNPKSTLGLLGLLAVFVLFCLGVPSFAKIFMLLLGFTFLAFCNSMLFVKIFRSYEEDTNINQL